MLNCLWDLTDITKSCVDLEVLHLTELQCFLVLFEKLNLRASETSTQTQPHTSTYKLPQFTFSNFTHTRAAEKQKLPQNQDQAEEHPHGSLHCSQVSPKVWRASLIPQTPSAQGACSAGMLWLDQALLLSCRLSEFTTP